MAAAPKPVTGREALKRVLEKNDAPMKTADLMKAAIKVRGIRLKGRTPEQTLAAILAVDAKQSEGDFVRTAPGTYGRRSRDS
jgi:hypothetical protein